MKCPCCEKEMIDGRPSIYEWGSVFWKKPATLAFVPNDKTKKKKKANQFENMEAYYCEDCNKIVTITTAAKSIF